MNKEAGMECKACGYSGDDWRPLDVTVTERKPDASGEPYTFPVVLYACPECGTVVASR